MAEVFTFEEAQDEHPPVSLPDGSVATVRSIGVGDERGEWVIPTIIGGKAVSEDEAIRLWKSGQNKALGGPFKTVEEGTDFAQRFHESEAKRIGVGQPESFSFEDAQETPAVPKIRVEPWQEPGADLGPFGGYLPGTPGYAEHMREAAATLAVPPAAVGAAAEAILQPAADISTEFRRRTGIDPSAMPGQPIDLLRFPRVKPPPPGTKYPVAIEHLNKAHEAAAEFIEGLTAPGMPETLGFAGAKPVQALFAASVAGAIPQSVEELAAAPEGPEKTKAGVKLGMNLAMGELMRRGMAREPGVVAPPEPVARSRELVGPPATGEVLVRPPGARPPPSPPAEAPPPSPPPPTPTPAAPSTVVRVALPGSIPPESVVPAVRLIGGEVVRGRAGETHPDIIAREGIEATDIDQRGFVDAQGRFLDRESAAQGTQIPPEREPGRLHSTDLPAAKPAATNLEALQRQADALRQAIERDKDAPRLTQLQGQRINKLQALDARIAKEQARAKPIPTPPPEAAPVKPVSSAAAGKALRALVSADRGLVDELALNSPDSLRLSEDGTKLILEIDPRSGGPGTGPKAGATTSFINWLLSDKVAEGIAPDAIQSHMAQVQKARKIIEAAIGKKPKPTPAPVPEAAPAKLTPGKFTLRTEPGRLDGTIESVDGNLTIRASTATEPDGTFSVNTLQVFVSPGLLDKTIGGTAIQQVDLAKKIIGRTKEEARQKAYQAFTDEINKGGFGAVTPKPEAPKQLPAPAKPAEATPAAPSPTAPEVAPTGELPPLIEQPKAPKPLQAERRQIVRMLETLEEQDPRTGEFFAKEGQENRVNRLRTRLAEIERQLLPKPPAPAAPPPENVILNRGNVETTATPSPTSASPKGGFDAKQAKAQKKFLLDAVDQAIEAAPDTPSGQWQTPELQADWVRAGKSREGEPQRYGYGEQRTLTQEEYDALHAQWELAQSEQYRDLFEKYNIPTEAPASIAYRDISGEIQQAERGGPLGFGDRIGLLREAISKANHALIPKITIEVPGDGVFQVENTKSAIALFREGAKRFPTTAPRAPKPKGGARETPTPASALGKMDKESTLDAAAAHVSTDPSRRIIQYIWSDGKQTVAVDGRRLVRISKGLGGSEAKPKLFKTDGTPLTDAQVKEIGIEYPKFKQVIPENVPIAAKGLDTQKLFTLLVQAEHMTSERSNSVKLWKNEDGTIGISSETPELGSYEGNIKPGAMILAAVNPVYLRDIINSARKVGHEKIDLHVTDELSPVVVKAPGFEAVLMPMRLSGRFPEVVGKSLSREAIASRLRERHGIEEGEIVRIIDDPTERASARLIYDADRRPVGIEVNRAQIPSNGVLDWAIQHEAAHWFDLEHPEAAQNLRGRLTGVEWERIQNQIERLGYRPEAFAVERTALGIQRLAEAWRGRNWFERIVGNVMRFASDTIGIKMSRLAAESTAVRAIAQAIGRIGEARPNEVSRILAMTPDEVIRWKRDTRYGAETMREIAGQVRPDQMGALVRERDKLRAQSTALSATRQVPNIERALRVSLKAQTLNELIENAPRAGGVMEARAPTPPPVSPLEELSRKIGSRSISPDEPLSTRIKQAINLAGRWSKGKDAVTGALGRMTAAKDALIGGYVNLPKWTNFVDSIGKWKGADQRTALEVREFQKAINRAVPSKLRQEAMTNWIQADGDLAVLQERADASKPSVRPGYIAAMNLNPAEQALARNAKAYLETRLQEGIKLGLLKQGVDNYVTQIWKRPNAVTQRMWADLFGVGALNPNFKFAKKRIFDSYFEGEQAGFTPRNKTLGHLLSVYDLAFNRAVSARGLIKSLQKGKASDGMPIAMTSGKTSPVMGDSDIPEAFLIKPNSVPEGAVSKDGRPYRPIDHWALRDWKWATKGPEGQNVFVQGDMLVHPDHWEHLNNVLKTSRLQANPITRGLLKASGFAKQTKLSLSPFHTVQEGVHALAHRVNPVNPAEIDLKMPDQKALVDHGLMVQDPRAYELFAEGSGGGGAVRFIPGLGRLQQWYTEMTFRDYIPRLKMQMAVDALERNRTAYAKQIAAGKVTDDQIIALTARESNAAFGEQNYAMMGRSPTTQDFLRLTLLAPDFLEARFRFVAQALTPYGREQRIALALMGATLYAGARVLNKALDDDYHWDKPFSVFSGGREYRLRTVLGDVQHLITDPRSFWYNRISPAGRTFIEYVTSRDDRGIKRNSAEQFVDFLSWFKPIPFQTRAGEGPREMLLASVGVPSLAASKQKQLYDLVDKWAENQPDPMIREAHQRQRQETHVTSPYGPLRFALLANDMPAAQRAYDELVKTRPPARIVQAMNPERPFTGSQAAEWKFRATLTPRQQAIYQAARQERRDMQQRFFRLNRFPKQAAPIEQ